MMDGGEEIMIDQTPIGPSQDEVKETIYDKLLRLTDDHAVLMSQRKKLQSFKPSKKSILMIAEEAKSPSMTAAIQERNALAHPEYLELLDGIQIAIEEEEKAKNKVDILNLWIEERKLKERREIAEAYHRQ